MPAARRLAEVSDSALRGAQWWSATSPTSTAVAQLVDRIFAAFGTVDCLVNNAGVLSGTRGQDLLDVTPRDFDNVMAVNLRGTFFLTQEIARRMVAEGDADRPVERSIITISSGCGGACPHRFARVRVLQDLPRADVADVRACASASTAFAPTRSARGSTRRR